MGEMWATRCRLFVMSCVLLSLLPGLGEAKVVSHQQVLDASLSRTWQSVRDKESPVGGVKDFVITLHGRLMYERQESEAMIRLMMGQWNKTANKVLGQMVDINKIIKGYNVSIEEQMDELRTVLHTVDTIRQEQEPVKRRLEEVWLIHNTTQINWDSKIQDITRQRDTALGSLQEVEEILARMKGPKPDTDIYGKLVQMQKNAGTDRLTSIFQQAVSAAASPSTPKDASLDVLNDVFGSLRTNLLSHTESLWEDLILANRSRTEHTAKMMNHIRGLQAECKVFDDKIEVEERPLKDIREYLHELETKRAPEMFRLEELNVQYSKLNERMKTELEQFHEHNLSMNERMETIENMHQFVKARLVDGNLATKLLLDSIRNPLLPKGNFTLDWSSLTKVDLKVDPANFRTELCASWKFSESSDEPYTVDSSTYGNDGKLHGLYIRRAQGGHNGNTSSIVFDGINDYVDVGKVGGFGEHLNNFTVEFWIKTTDTHPASASVMKTVEKGQGIVFAVDMNRRVGRRNEEGMFPVGQQATAQLDIEPGSTLVYLRDTRGRVLAGHVRADYFDGKWHHIQWSVINSAQNDMRFWMDGQPYPFIATVEQGPSAFANFSSNLFLGASDTRGKPDSYFDGALSHVQLWCQAEAAPPVRTCCKICNGHQKACGDSCIPDHLNCNQNVGCACNDGEPGVPSRPNLPVNYKTS